MSIDTLIPQTSETLRLNPFEVINSLCQDTLQELGIPNTMFADILNSTTSLDYIGSIQDGNSGETQSMSIVCGAVAGSKDENYIVRFSPSILYGEPNAMSEETFKIGPGGVCDANNPDILHDSHEVLGRILYTADQSARPIIRLK